MATMLRFTLTLIAIASAAVAYADVYKTVDAQGQVHYSDQWSPGAELIKGDHEHLNLDNAPAASPPPSTAADPGEQAARKAVDSDMAAIHADECKRLQDQYQKELRARRIIQASSSGPDPQYMSDADADAERVKTRQAMDEACGASQSQPGT
jgi:hypothetical protein